MAEEEAKTKQKLSLKSKLRIRKDEKETGGEIVKEESTKEPSLDGEESEEKAPETDLEAPLSEGEAKDLAVSLLKKGSSIEEVEDKTGLSIMVIRGLKGGIAKKAKKKEKEDKQKAKTKARAERPSVFKKPKTPSEILEGVCEEHQLNAKFIDLVVKRSDRIGGIHPVDFRRMLAELDSGIGKNKAEADYIADDYYYALQQSQKNAQEAGYRMSYPLDMHRDARDEYDHRRPFSEPRRDEPPYERNRYYPPSERGYTPSSGYRKAFGGAEITKEDVMDIITDALTKKKQEDKIDELYNKMDERDRKRDEEMKEFMKEMKDTTSTPVAPPDNVTKEDLMHMFEKKDASETIKAQEERIKMEKELRIAERKSQDEKHKDLMQDIRTLKDEIRNKPANISTEGYKDDSIRLLADTMNTLAPGRYPIRDGLKIVFSPIGEKERPQREKVSGESSIFDSLPSDMILEE